MIPNKWLTTAKTALSLGFLLPILRRFVRSPPSWQFEAKLPDQPIGIIMGSQSDWATMQAGGHMLDALSVGL